MSKCTTRSGLVLLVCMMVIALTSVLTLGVLECLRARTMLATRVSEETRAELLAEAGIQHGVAVLSDDETWRGASSWTAHPPGASDLYQYKIESVSDGKVGITGYGQANHATLQRYIELDLSKPFYLRDYRLPVADLVQVPPTQLMLPDYDDDGKLGTTLKESDKGLLETDPAQ